MLHKSHITRGVYKRHFLLQLTSVCMSLSSRSMSKIGDNLFSYKIKKLRITNLIPRVLSISSSRVGLVGENSGNEVGRINYGIVKKNKQTNSNHKMKEGSGRKLRKP